MKKRPHKQAKYQTVVATTGIDILPDKVRAAMLKAIALVKRYHLPCDVAVTDLPSTARHVWRKDGTCEIQLSWILVCNGDERAIHRRIIHEAAHHIAGPKHLDHEDKHFRNIAAQLYEREGFRRGMPGDGCGNM